MEYVHNAESLNDFLDSSNKYDVKYIGDAIIRFMFTNLFKHKMIYTDVHYGNFLIQNNKRLYVLDFGSIHYVDEKIFDKLPVLLCSLYQRDKDTFYDTMEILGVISKTKPISEESREYMWDYFMLQFAPWLLIDDDFEFTEIWLDDCGLRNVTLMNEWVLPSNMIWLNKLCHGFSHVLARMNFKGNYIKLFQELGVYPSS